MHYSFALLFFCITPCDTFMYSMHGVVYDTIYAVIFFSSFAKLRIICFPSKFFNAKSNVLLRFYSKSINFLHILLMFISSKLLIFTI